MCDEAPTEEAPRCSSCSGSLEDQCSNCEKCLECCGCHVCTSCNERVESVCSRCDECNECCGCITCPSCDRPRSPDDICGECAECSRCCDCQHCDSCGDRSDEICSECDRCYSCCRCSKVELVEREITFHRAQKHQHERNPSQRFIACELEIAKVSCGNDVSHICQMDGHSVVYDRSITNGGFEINTTPASGDIFCDRIERLCDALSDSTAKVDSSCGYHVHVDARDFKYWDIRRLILLYAKLEDGLFSVVAPSRRDNGNCYRCGYSLVQAINSPLHRKSAKEALAQALYGMDKSTIQSRRTEKYGGSGCDTRYNALNVHSWIYRGTIECRLHQGTYAAKKVICWAILWAGILDWVQKHPEKDISKLPTDSFQALLEVAPTQEVKEFLIERKQNFGR